MDGLVAQLCKAAPLGEARDLRRRALDLLTSRFSDSLRWSSLLTTRFIPAFDRIPRQQWSREITEYDRILDRLYETASNDRVKADLLYAKARVRVHLNRQWDWLTEAQRRNTIRLLNTIQIRFGGLPCPGSSEPRDQNVGDRARQHLYELQKLYFGAPAPAASGGDLQGNPLDIADFKGKIVVLDFWTSFCQPCLAMVPHIRTLLGKLEGEPVVYVGVCGDTDRQQGLGTARRVEMTWRNLWDGPQGPRGPASIAWNVAASGWPTVFVIDADGRIRFMLYGKQQVEADLESAIRTLLGERVKRPTPNKARG